MRRQSRSSSYRYVVDLGERVRGDDSGEGAGHYVRAGQATSRGSPGYHPASTSEGNKVPVYPPCRGSRAALVRRRSTLADLRARRDHTGR